MPDMTRIATRVGDPSVVCHDLPAGQMDCDGYTPPPIKAATARCSGYPCLSSGYGSGAGTPSPAPSASSSATASTSTSPAPTLPVTSGPSVEVFVIAGTLLVALGVIILIVVNIRSTSRGRPRKGDHRAV